ncbi:MAG: twin-arginine translocase subunit TatC [Deltaproteobacteria bacterium]|nr:twin-arginine translocase subunit TatC [Deltaproteobacteria bacterium]
MDETRLPLTEHLAELRRRIVRALLFWVAGTGVAWWFREAIFRELLRPAVAALAREGGHLQAIAPGEIFFTYLKGAALAGFVLALPGVLWQVWAFIAPGLYPGEKKLAVPFVLTSTLLFVAGAFFGHRFVFPAMFTFLGEFESEFVQAAWSMREVWSMTTSMFLAFGVAFQLPVVVFFLASAGILTVRQLLRYFPYAILINFVIGAVLTPSPDWVSQSMLAVPMCVLYLLGVGVAWLFGGKRARGTSGEKPDAGAVARV